MTQNIGRTDRIIRIILGIIIVGTGIYLQSAIGFIGLIPLVTGVIGWCPTYLPFGISTCKERDRT